MQFIRDSSIFSISLVLGACCNIIRSFFIAKFLGPQGYGIWRFLNIFLEYLYFASLGTQAGLQRMIPSLRGLGHIKQIKNVLNTACATNLYSSVLYSLVVLVWSFFVKESSSSQALAVFSPVILLSAWLNYTLGFSMATSLYNLRSSLELLHAILSMLFILGLVTVLGVYGAIAGLGLSTLLVLIISTKKLWEYFALKIDYQILFNLIITGIPIMANGVALTTMSAADRILIASMLDWPTLGIYSIGNTCTGILGMIPSAFGQMLFVKFAEMDGENQNQEHISNVLDQSITVLAPLLALLTSLTIAIFPLAVVIFLPNYSDGIAAGRILIASMFFLGISLPATNWCISTGRFVPVLLLRTAVIVAELIAVYFVIRAGSSLESIALCVLYAFATFGIVMIIICNHLLENPLLTSIVQVGKGLLPFFSIYAVIWMQDSVYSLKAGLFVTPLLISCILASFLSLALSVPFIYWAHKRTRILSMILKRS